MECKKVKKTILTIIFSPPLINHLINFKQLSEAILYHHNTSSI